MSEKLPAIPRDESQPYGGPAIEIQPSSPIADAIEESKRRIENPHEAAAVDASGNTIGAADIWAERAAIAANEITKNESDEEPWTAVKMREIAKTESGLELIESQMARSQILKELDSETAQDSHETDGESFDDSGSRMSEEEANLVLGHGSLRDVEVFGEAADQAAFDALEENPTNNTGIGDEKFAETQFNSAICRLRILDIKEKENGSPELNEQINETLEEVKLWQKVLAGEHPSGAEDGFIRKRALDIRKRFRDAEKKASPDEGEISKYFDDPEALARLAYQKALEAKAEGDDKAFERFKPMTLKIPELSKAGLGAAEIIKQLGLEKELPKTFKALVIFRAWKNRFERTAK